MYITIHGSKNVKKIVSFKSKLHILVSCLTYLIINIKLAVGLFLCGCYLIYRINHQIRQDAQKIRGRLTSEALRHFPVTRHIHASS
jgi:hypothetical protein